MPPPRQGSAEQSSPVMQQPGNAGQDSARATGNNPILNSPLFSKDEDIISYARSIARNVPGRWMLEDIEQNGEGFLAAIKQNPDLLLMIAQDPRQYRTLRDLFGLGRENKTRSFPVNGYPAGGVGPMTPATQIAFDDLVERAKRLAFDNDALREDLKKYPHAFELLGSFSDFLPIVEKYPNWYPVLRKAFELWEQRYNSGAPNSTGNPEQ